jgi:ankyrin repeat protein
MYRAAESGRVDVLSVLLDHGADIDEIPTNPLIRKREPRISTPLHAAVQKNQRAAVKFLLDRGAKKSIKNTDGKSVLEVAEESKYTELVELLDKRKQEDV